MKKSHFLNFIKKISLFSYVLLSLFLIYHATLNGNESSNASNSVGSGIAGIINGNTGDQTDFIVPEEVKINNPIPSAFVNESYNIDAFIYPENSSFLSLKYESSNEEIASVDNNGYVRFVSPGFVKIKVSSLSFEDVYNEFTVEVIKANLVDINVDINKAGKSVSVKDDKFVLENNETYALNYTFVPIYFTSEITYEYDTNILEIKNGQIYTKSTSDLTTIKLSCDDFVKEINIKIIKNSNDYVYLEDLDSSDDLIELSLGQVVNLNKTNIFKINFIPSDASNKKLKYESLNTDIVYFKNNNMYAISCGKAKVKIISVENEDIYIIMDISVSEVNVSSFDIKINNLDTNKLNIDKSYKITLDNVKPKNATYNYLLDKDYLNFESSNENIIRIDDYGNLILLNEGNASLTVELLNFDNNGNVISSVKETIDLLVFSYDFIDDFKYSFSEEFDVLYTNNVYKNFKNSFKIDELYNNGSIVNNDFDKSFTLKLVNEIEGVEFKSNDLYISNIDNSIINFSITHNESGISKFVSFLCINEINIKNNNNDFYVGDIELIKFENEFDDYVINYNQDNMFFDIVSQTSEGFSIECLDVGSFSVNIIPSLNGDLLYDYSKTFEFSISEKLISDFDLSFKYKGNEEEIVYIKEGNKYYLNCINTKEIVFDIDYLPFSNPTLSNVVITIDNEDLINYESGVISLLNIGESCILIEDKVSNTKAFVYIVSENIIDLDDNAFVFDHKQMHFDENLNKYFIKNGISGKIELNFSDDSTFKEVVFSSSDESILLIGEDGVFSPLKEGEVIIKALVSDGEKEIVLLFNIKVERQKVIEDLASFFYKIRKNIGHFGAFFVLGVLASFAFLFMFDYKKWYLAIIVTFVSGFAIAGLTEFIQVFVPGRSGVWSDVCLDMYGFLLSFSIILVFYFINYFKNYKKNDRILESEI